MPPEKRGRRAVPYTVVLLFLVSVVCRGPFLARPLEGPHDWLTIHSLLTISLWNTMGLERTHYSLIMTYPNAADKFISRCPEGTCVVFDREGNSYFVSFPPFAFLFGFWVLNLFHLPPQAIWLKAINLTLLLPAVLLLALMLEEMFNGEDRRSAEKLAVLGAALFLFNRAVLLSFGNLYFPITLVLPIWMMAVYAYAAAQDAPRHRPGFLALFFVLTFLASYCDWFGLLCAAGFCLWSLANWRGDIVNRWLAALAAGAGALAVALTVVQYSSINGIGSLLSVVLSRFTDRAGLGGNVSEYGWTLWNPHTYYELAHRYREQYAPLLVLIGALGFVYLLFPQLASRLHWTKDVRRSFFLFGFPLVSDQLLLVNHSAIHDYASLKAAPLLTVLAVLLMDGLVRPRPSDRPAPAGAGLWMQASPIARLQLIVVVACLLSTKLYLSERGNLSSETSALGREIRRYSHAEQVIFLIRRHAHENSSPNLIYFSGRNVEMIDGEPDAQEFLRRYGRQAGMIFRANDDGQLVAPPQVIGAQ